MHPAPSVIIFTTISGAGFGLLFWLGLGEPTVIGRGAFFFYLVAYALAVGGLISSTFHLGHPERALKAFTQWRTSWLSREGWLACLTLILGALYAAWEVFFFTRLIALGWLVAGLSVATILATSMIYAQLRTVPRWNAWTTPLLYLLTGLTSGALLAGEITYAIPLLAITGTLQVLTFIDGDRRLARSGSTVATATQLGNLGTVRPFEPPHTGSNYLTREMVFRVGRKHASTLRILSVLLLAGIPILLLLLPFNHVWGVLAVLSHLAGAFAARWLFFAEAEHVVSLYYGR